VGVADGITEWRMSRRIEFLSDHYILMRIEDSRDVSPCEEDKGRYFFRWSTHRMRRDLMETEVSVKAWIAASFGGDPHDRKGQSKRRSYNAAGGFRQ